MTIHLVLSRHWFVEIKAGRKLVEYRRICDYWRKRIWDKYASLNSVVFHRGYTDTVIIRKITYIDRGQCPYEGWNGQYYRIHFSREMPEVLT